MKEEKYAGLHLDRSFYRGTSCLANLGKTKKLQEEPKFDHVNNSNANQGRIALDDPCLIDLEWELQADFPY